MDLAEPSRRRPETTGNGKPGSPPTDGFPRGPRRARPRTRWPLSHAIVAAPAGALRVAMPLLAALAVLPSFAQAQTVYVSNTGQGDHSEKGLGGSSNAQQAQQFTTGSQLGGYVLGAVELDLGPTGTERDVVVSIWSDSRNRPDALMHTLTNPDSFVTGLNRFTGTNITLSADTKYHVVVTVTSSSTWAIGATRRAQEDAGKAAGWSIRATHGAQLVENSRGASGLWGLSPALGREGRAQGLADLGGRGADDRGDGPGDH